jgi:hypothetical protein
MARAGTDDLVPISGAGMHISSIAAKLQHLSIRLAVVTSLMYRCNLKAGANLNKALLQLAQEQLGETVFLG